MENSVMQGMVHFGRCLMQVHLQEGHGLRCAYRGSHVLEFVVVPILGHNGNAFTEVIRLEHSQLLILPSLRLLQAHRTLFEEY